MTSRVIDCLFRISWRKCSPIGSPVSASLNMYSLRPNGVSHRSGSPSGGSHLIVSAPSSESIEEHQLPIIIPLLRSRTRTVVRFSGFLKFSV